VLEEDVSAAISRRGSRASQIVTVSARWCAGLGQVDDFLDRQAACSSQSLTWAWLKPSRAWACSSRNLHGHAGRNPQ
jgi:hypothetical protein